MLILVVEPFFFIIYNIYTKYMYICIHKIESHVYAGSKMGQVAVCLLCIGNDGCVHLSLLNGETATWNVTI